MIKNILKKLCKKKPPGEFSKKIFTGVSVLTVFVTVVILGLMFYTHDMSPAAYLIPAVYAEFATATGFYFSKAKAENQIKIKEEYKKKGLNYTDETDSSV